VIRRSLHWPAALLLTLIVGTVCHADGPLDRISEAVVSITCRDAPNRYIGTGVVVHPYGYVLTSTTVVPPGATDIQVMFLGPQGRDGRLVHADESMELALLHVELPGFVEPLTLRRASTVELGETVFSIGDAWYAFRTSGRFLVSLGVLSGRYTLSEQLAQLPVYTGRFLETTAANNPGMDGGPLLDGSGQIIGLLSLNISPVRWLGVAIPIDALIDDMQRAINADLVRQRQPAPKRVWPRLTDRPGEQIFPRHAQLDRQFAAAMRQVGPAVVSIVVDRVGPDSRPATRAARPTGRSRPSPGHAGIRNRPDAPVSGVLISPDGEVLTSRYNVAGNVRGLTVVLADGRRLAATKLGTDELRDLALLKVEATGLPFVSFAAEAPPIGTRVAVLGRSPEPTLTVTRGIVGASGRMDGTAVQIDASVNPGNAGGPLIDAAGRCLGLVAHADPGAMWGVNSGVAFATTGLSLAEVLDDLRAGAHLARPPRGFLGVRMSSGEFDKPGVGVAQVIPDTGAARAGLRRGDRILTIDGQPVNDMFDLAGIIASARPGQTVRLEVLRDGKELTIEATLGAHPYR